MTDKLRNMVELARFHVEKGGLAPARVYYRMILKDTSPPKNGLERLANGEACVFYARDARAHARMGEALDWYQKALAADPLAIDYRIEYIVRALVPMNLMKNARIEAERATKIEPTCKEAWRTLGGVEQAMGNTEACIEAYDRQLALDPFEPNARLDRATIALDTADYDTVRKMVEPVLGTDRAPDGNHVLGMVSYREGNHEKAVELYERAIKADCHDTALAHWNKSLALHSIGRYREGWAEHEYRGKQTTDGGMALLMNRFSLPMWNGEPPPARLHLHQEMGHGDAIAMARYIPILLERGYDVTVEVTDSLVSLFARSFPGAKVVPKAIDYPGSLGLPVFDYHVPMLSLPYLLNTDIDTVPWDGPYLKAEHKPHQISTYAIPKVGLCWSSGIRHDGLWLAEYGRRKSMSFDELTPLFVTNRDKIWVSLQAGPERAQCVGAVVKPLSAKPTWDETASIIDQLDLVITVDTSVAHLAGALGKPVWVMMHTEGSWHWMAERPGASWNERSPWYPTARLYRQKTAREWNDVVERVSRDLKKMSAVALAS